MPRIVLCLMLAVLLAACSDDPGLPAPTPIAIQIEDLPGNGFEVRLSGAIEDTISGTADMIFDPALGYAMYMRSGGMNVSLILPQEIQRGNFNILPGLEVYNSSNKVIAVGALATQQISTDGLPRFYATVENGRLTLISTVVFSGAFEFTVLSETGETLFVQGRFREVQPEAVTVP